MPYVMLCIHAPNTARLLQVLAVPHVRTSTGRQMLRLPRETTTVHTKRCACSATPSTRGNPQRPNARPLRQTTSVLAPVRAPHVVPLATWNERHPQVLRQQREPALHTVRLSRNCQRSKPVAHSPILRASLKSLRPTPTYLRDIATPQLAPTASSG